MKIIVFDVPAENGGALTILKEYYEMAINDSGNNWVFVVSTPNLPDMKNIKVIRYPWVKKSWFHRLYFDMFLSHKIVEEYNADEVLSLQNVIVNRVRIKQTLYLHNSLPFVEKRYGFTENPKFWIYQNILDKLIIRSIKKADKVLVQTEWLKKACIEKAKVNSNKFEVKQPDFYIDNLKKFNKDNQDEILFFFPASEFIYKNHQVIVEAVKQIKDRKIKKYQVFFTLEGNENKNIKKLYNITKEYNLPIYFIGQITREEVYEYYRKSILIFPSYIETFGLPMLEAKMHGTPILASNCLFSHEILDDYDSVSFFDPHDSTRLAELIVEEVTKK